jgi:prepilin peptidase CpaA
MAAAIILVVFPFAMIFAALSDVFTMTIANRVSAVLIASFLIVAPFIGLSWADFASHIAAFVVVLAVTFALFAAGTMGGGDAKLLASTAIWMGMSMNLVTYLVVASFAGGVLTLVLLKLRNSSVAVFVGEVSVLRRVVDEKDIPYGVALAIGGLFAYANSPAMIYALNYFALN